MTNIVYKYPHSNDNSQYASDCQTGGGEGGGVGVACFLQFLMTYGHPLNSTKEDKSTTLVEPVPIAARLSGGSGIVKTCGHKIKGRVGGGIFLQFLMACSNRKYRTTEWKKCITLQGCK